MNKLICRLTGGHIYTTEKLNCMLDVSAHMFTFTNRCVRCGKTIIKQIPEKDFAPYLNAVQKED